MREGHCTVLAVCYLGKLSARSFRGRSWAGLEGSLQDRAFEVLGFASALDRVQSRMLLHGLVSRSVTDDEQDLLLPCTRSQTLDYTVPAIRTAGRSPNC